MSDAPARRRLRVTLVSAETFEHESRGRRIARALIADGHDVRVIAHAGDRLPAEETIDGIRVTRLALDRRISAALRPLPPRGRIMVARLIGLDPEAIILPATRPRGLDWLRYPLRRLLELLGHTRRVGPWTAALVAAAPGTDIFQTQSLPALPVVKAAAERVGARFVYDFADYQTEAARLARLPRVVRAVLRRRERGLARQAVGRLAVSEPMADLVAARLGVTRPAVVMNCPPVWRANESGPPSSGRLRAELKLAPERPIVLHHGQFKPGRGIEELVRAADDPRLRAIDPAIVLLGFGRLRPQLEEAARRRPERVYVLSAVPVEELLDWVASADVAYLGCPPLTLNLRLTIPNKLFEALMAGVPVVAAKGTEQARVVAQEAVGRCVDIASSDQLATALIELLALPEPERTALRQHCRSLALTKYNWELKSQPLVDLYRQL